MPKCTLILSIVNQLSWTRVMVLPCITTIVHLLYEQWTPNIYLLTLSRIIKNRTEFRTQMVAENGNILI